MERVTKENLFGNSKISLINTRQKRYNNVKFSTELIGDKFVLTSDEGKLEITQFDEIVLYIIAKFRFLPAWMAKQWYNDKSDGITIGEEDSSISKLRSFINFGLIYEFPSAVAVFLMPTDRLATLFGINLGSFRDPPYNTLTHTISEEQVMFDCLNGNAEYLKDIQTIPFVSLLGLGNKGSFCIPESEYSIRNSYFKKHVEEFNDQEANLAQEVLEGKIITTSDFKEFKLTIHKKISQYDYDLKIPDLSVLAPRVIKDSIALPQSIALEVELSCKGTETYKKILDLYWDNLKFGHVVYLVSNVNTKNCLVEAYEEISKTHSEEDRTCTFHMEEFIVPYNREQTIKSDN